MSTSMFKLAVVVVGGVLVGSATFLVWTSAGATTTPSTTLLVAAETTTLGVTTTVAPTTTTIPTTTTTSRGSLLVHGTGDVALDPVYIPTLAAEGWDHAWSGLEGLFLGDDLTLVNLECVPSDLGAPLDKEFVFQCPVESLPSLRNAGVEVANLGNNHSGDYGKEALVDGRDQLIAAGVAPVGVGRDAGEAGAPAVFEVNGWKVAVVGFGGVAPSPSWYAADDRAGMRNGKDTETMVEAVAAAEEMADIVIVTIHWGRELDTEPRPDDMANARAMIEAGADVIFGHHAHRLAPLEMVDGAAVFWQLGNFIWPHNSTESATTAVARVVVAPDGSLDACLIPAYIATHGRPVLTGAPTCGPGV
ncbi:MAG: CapA family protein [Actinobacteria bacterium]|nr:CapA family protein [Actinomycetota bacterium]